MTTQERNKYKVPLERKLAELGVPMSRREDIAVERKADILEEVQDDLIRDLAARNLSSETLRIPRIRDALRRIADGSFGICLECGEAIPPKRFNAIPWAEFCVPCQRIKDQESVIEDIRNGKDARFGKWNWDHEAPAERRERLRGV